MICIGIDTLFQMALALLMVCKKDLLQQDFEGILKYFRVSLPKKCRSEEAAKQLIKLACSIKVKKLKKYEADFITLKGECFLVLFFCAYLTLSSSLDFAMFRSKFALKKSCA